MRTIAPLLIFALAASTAAVQSPRQTASVPAWKKLPIAKPLGRKEFTGAYTVRDPRATTWKAPKFVYNERAATGRKLAKVIVLIYNPRIPSEGNKTLIDVKHANDPYEYSRILCNVIRDSSWGYINYEIVSFIEVDGFPTKVDGYKYTPDKFMADTKAQKWYSENSSYRLMLEDNHLVDRIKKEHITDVWVWGASGMAIDEYAGFISNRYARFAPTDNPWFYRPYDIPDLGQTLWMMGFNYEVGPDNMVHSYTHRVEGQLALAYGKGTWNTQRERDPWNVFSFLEMDNPGSPSMVGNCHVPPNGQGGYDYNNKRRVLSWADNWYHFPDLRGKEREVSSAEWGNNQLGYQRWILNLLPKYPGYTKYGYNNAWMYVANVDEDLPEFKMPDPTKLVLPDDYPAPHERTRQ